MEGGRWQTNRPDYMFAKANAMFGKANMDRLLNQSDDVFQVGF
jgi:hypothetical protein